MRKLTKEQQKIVEDNHNLIYSFIHKRGLDVDEYYGIVAESLCKAVLNWDKSKGNLSTIFYIVARNDLYQEWRKGIASKRKHEGIVSLEDELVLDDYNLEDEIVLKETLEELKNSEFRELLELKLLGYNQKEIASMLGVSQVTISRWLRKIGEKYFDRKG